MVRTLFIEYIVFMMVLNEIHQMKLYLLPYDFSTLALTISRSTGFGQSQTFR